MKITFGQPITLSFTATAGPKIVAIDSIEAVRVYESQPSDDQVNDSTNSNGDFVVGTTTSGDFVEGTDNEWTITLPKITQPEVKTGGWKRYWYAINYKYTALGDVVGQWESFVIWYPDAIQTRFGVTASDLYAMQSKFEDRSRAGEAFCNAKIALAEELLVAHLNTKGLDRNLIYEEDLKLILKTWAAALACNDLSSEAGDSWEVKSLFYENAYKDYLGNIKVHYDMEGDNIVDDQLDEVKPRNAVMLR